MYWKSDGLFYETKDFINKVGEHKHDFRYYAKLCIYPFVNVFYKIVSLGLKAPKYDKKYDVAIVSIFKNEAPFLKEWLEYHMCVGVKHFYLYNNNSTDDYENILSPYIEKGIVTLTDWPEIPGQISCYKHWYGKYRHDSQWVSFLDLDEYICPLYDNDLPALLRRFPKYPVLMMYWLIFGTSGIITLDKKKLLIEQNIICWDKNYPLGKVFYNTDYEINNFAKGMMHHFSVSFHGLLIPPFNDSGYCIKWPDINPINKKRMCVQVNHYISRSYENIEEKVGRGSAAFAKSWKTMNLALRKEYNCKSVNYTIQRFLLQVRIRLLDSNKI